MSSSWVVLTLGITVTTVTIVSPQTVSVHTKLTVLTVSPQYLDSHTAHSLSSRWQCNLKYKQEQEQDCFGYFLSMLWTKKSLLTTVASNTCHTAMVVG